MCFNPLQASRTFHSDYTKALSAEAIHSLNVEPSHKQRNSTNCMNSVLQQ